MDKNILISIILSTYNRRNFLEKISIPSILRQTYKNWELIIVDDASQYGTEEFVNRLIKKCSNKIKYLKFDKNQGYAQTINEGLRLCESDYIALLDSDDGWFSTKLEEQLDFMIKNNLQISTCQVLEYDLTKKRIIGITTVGLPGLIFDKKIFEFIYPLNPKLRGIEDGEFFIKLELAKIKNTLPEVSYTVLNKPLVFYIRHSQALSFFEKNMIEKMLNKYQILFQEYSFLIEKEDNLSYSENLKNILYLNLLRYSLYLIMSNDKKLAKEILMKAKKFNQDLLWFLVKFLIYLPPKLAFVFKNFSRSVIIEKIIYKINFFKSSKNFDQKYKKEIEFFINVCKNL